MSVINRKYGWKRSLPDQRDLLFHAESLIDLASLPSVVDLRPNCSAVLDQGELGSCTAHALAGAIEFDYIKQKTKIFTPSRLFIYYSERTIEGTVTSDAGAEIRDGIKSVAALGAPPEYLWPYNVTQFAVQPPHAAYLAAAQHRVKAYSSVQQDLNQMRGCLAARFPIVVGITVYESFESQAVAETGVVPMPQMNEEVLGGHAILAVGYNDHDQVFYMKNSWGVGWGLKGYFTLPYAYLTNPNLADDFWQITTAS